MNTIGICKSSRINHLVCFIFYEKWVQGEKICAIMAHLPYVSFVLFCAFVIHLPGYYSQLCSCNSSETFAHLLIFRWSLDSPLEMVVAAKSTPWPDRILVVPSPPHLPSKRRAGRRDGRPRHLKQRADATKGRPDTTRRIIVPDVRGHK